MKRELPEGRKPLTTMESADLVLRMHNKLAAGFTAGDRISQLEELYEAAKQDAKEAEAYAEELEAKLATCKKYRDAYAECDRISTHALRKAVEALDEAVYLLAPDEEDMAKKAGVYRVVTTLAELKGETEWAVQSPL